MSHLLDVAADDVGDAIAHAGGLMFDLGRAGWHVRVLTDDPAHDRALRILGTRTIAPGSGVTPVSAPHRLQLHWRTPQPAGQLHPVQFRLSAAARTFKAQALLCVGPPRRVDGCEQFWADSVVDGSPFAGCHPSIAVVG